MVKHDYLMTSEVAEMLKVSPKTIARWATEGKLPHVRTLGGHRRFDPEVVERIRAELAGAAA